MASPVVPNSLGEVLPVVEYVRSVEKQVGVGPTAVGLLARGACGLVGHGNMHERHVAGETGRAWHRLRLAVCSGSQEGVFRVFRVRVRVCVCARLKAVRIAGWVTARVNRCSID